MREREKESWLAIVRVPEIQETAAAAVSKRETGHRTTTPATVPATKRKFYQVKYRQTEDTSMKHLKERRGSVEVGPGQDLSRTRQ